MTNSAPRNTLPFYLRLNLRGSRGDAHKFHVLSIAAFRITPYRYQKFADPTSLKLSPNRKP